MKRPEEEFRHASFAQVSCMIDMFADEVQMKAAAMNNEPYTSKYFDPKPEVVNVKSMKEVPGF
jgi:hypothetical protein